MKLWSRGLGTTEITMDFRDYKVKKDSQSSNIFIIGNIKDPVNWEFRITLEPEDIAGFLKVFFHFSVLRLGIYNAHRFVQYLMNRKNYADATDEKLEEKVNAAYETMMRRSRIGRRPQNSKDAGEEENPQRSQAAS